MTAWNLDCFIITENEGTYRWYRAITDELVMYGLCTLNDGVLILHSYDAIDACEMPPAENKWCITEYFMTVTETGVTEVLRSSDGTAADDETKKAIGTQVGCTLRFRQG